MALIAVKIESEASLLMNEFFDYGGYCYAISRSRAGRRPECIKLEDFYECTVRTDWIEDIPVIFVLGGQIIGWYKSAKIYRQLQHISVFLEGNIKARTMDACLLPKSRRIEGTAFDFSEKLYEVIEEDDARYSRLKKEMAIGGKGLPIRYELVESFFSADKLRLIQQKCKNDTERAQKQMYDFCIEACMKTARRIMQDECRDIRELKTMLAYANQAALYARGCVDAWYYRAMACDQLGFVKDGLKAIEKALAAEPDGDDLLVQKGHLLFALGKYEETIACYEEAFAISPDDSYLMCVGHVYFAMGNVDAAYRTYKRTADKSILKDYGIDLKDIEKRWPFVSVRGFSIRELFGRHEKR